MTHPVRQAESPLVVDLDGTLLHVDLLHEAMAGLALRSPIRLATILWDTRLDLARLKQAVAAACPLDPERLPYDSEVLAFLHREHAVGRPLILATASPLAWARSVATHLGIFATVIATSGGPNLKGAEKLAALRQVIGAGPFAYIGDSPADVALFDKASAGRLVAGSDQRLLGLLGRKKIPFEHLSPRARRARDYLRLLRPLHWSKNLLIGLPPLTSWGLYNPAALPALALVFVAFSAASSTVYILNDLADIAADRSHPDKRLRPLAAGLVGIPAALALLGGTAAIAVIFAWTAHPLALPTIAAYFALNLAYSAGLKELPLIDVVVLCAFYLLRVHLGATVLGLPASPWFLAFLGCLFAELALWKRYVESRLPPSPHSRRPYDTTDTPVLLAFGVGASFSAALVLALYLQSRHVSPVYSSPAFLGLLVPILLIHNLGMWLDASRGHSGSDPVLRVIFSRKSWVASVFAVAVILLSRLVAAQ